MHLYTELNEIPVPAYAHPDGYRIYINYPVGSGKTRKLYIGQYANKLEGTFYANENFRLYCPQEWADAYEKENAPHYQYNVGMYAMTLSVSHNTRLYPILHEAFGPLYGNALLDFAMYSIMERSNTAYRFKPAMEHEVIFSRDRKDDDWLGNVFNSLITADMIQQFRIKWIRECRRRGVLKVWISIDGSNNDCECRTSDLPCKTENKSGNNKTAVAYMYAVSAEDGRPVTFFAYHGDRVDSKAFSEMCEFLRGNGLEILGVILDRGFLNHPVLEMLKACKYQFVIMLKNDTYAHTHMVIDHGAEIYWNVEHLVGTDGLFGISDGPKQIFKNHEDTAYVNLFFDAKNGSERKIAFANKVYLAIQGAKEAIGRGEAPTFSNGMGAYLNIEEIPGNPEDPSGGDAQPPKYRIVPTELCNKILYKKGFESIATSENLGPEEANRIYHLRDASEKQFMICKSMEGCGVFRVHSTEGIRSKALTCFISSVIRREISIACESLGLKASLMLPQIERPALVLMGNGTYKYIHNMKENVECLFEKVGYTKADFETIAGEVNEREQSRGRGVSQYHRTPEEIRSAHTRLKEAEKLKEHTDNPLEMPTDDDKHIKPVTRLGRPPGSKNKKTLAKEASIFRSGASQKPGRKPGRPPGSKNKKTLAKEATGQLPTEKRKRGRPFGSKDKTPRKRRTKQELLEARNSEGVS